MTLIVACRFWKAVAVIADCRVSYAPPYEEVDDCLQKLYQIDDRLVLGFAGPLEGAQKIMKLVRRNTQGYSKPPIADNLQRDVERWIRRRYRELPEPHRENLSFVLATVEPGREKRSRWFWSDGQGNVEPSSKPSWFPYVPEWKTIALKPIASKPGELRREEKQLAKIIGVSGKDRKTVERTISECYGFAFKWPDRQIQVVLGFLMSRLMTSQVATIGGLFQCALLSEKGIQWLGYVGEEVVLEFAGGRFVQRNALTGQTLRLMTIWEWGESRPAPGSFGSFEDPGLQRAAENLGQTEGGQADDYAGAE